MPSPDPEMQAYAWNWFSLHSGQRMQMVSFWLVSIAFLAAAFVQAFMSKAYLIATGVSVIGLVASVAFMLLDARTRQLVQVGEAALRALEGQRATGDEVFGLVAAAGRNRASRWHSYRYIIQGLQLIVAGGFTLAIVYAVVSA